MEDKEILDAAIVTDRKEPAFQFKKPSIWLIIKTILKLNSCYPVPQDGQERMGEKRRQECTREEIQKTCRESVKNIRRPWTLGT